MNFKIGIYFQFIYKLIFPSDTLVLLKFYKMKVNTMKCMFFIIINDIHVKNVNILNKNLYST